MMEPCVQCGQEETDVMVCPACRAANLRAKLDKKTTPPTTDETYVSRAEIRNQRVQWLKQVLAQRGCYACKEDNPAYLMWMPVPTYSGPSMATMLNRLYSRKRFAKPLRQHVPSCWNHFYAKVDPDALYPSNFTGKD